MGMFGGGGAANAGTVEVDVEGDFNKFERDLKSKGASAGDKFGSSFGSSMGSKIAAAGAAYLGANFVKGVVSQASDLDESLNVTGLAFGDARAEIDETAKSAATMFGISESAYRGLSAQIGNIFVQSGTAQKDAAKLTNDLVGRATDIGSAWNASTSDVTESINAGLIGSFEPLRKYGVILDKATVEQYALANGLVDANGEVDAQNEKLATAALIMEQTNNVAGDFANTSDGVANSSKQVTAMWEDMQAQLGQGLLPVLSAGLGILKALGPEGMRTVLVIGGIVFAIIKLTQVAQGLGGAFTLLSANPIMLILLAVAALAIVIWRNWEPIKRFFGEDLPLAFEAFKIWAGGALDSVTGKLDGVSNAFTWLKDRAGEAWAGVKNFTGEAVDWLKAKLGELAAAADSALGPVDEIIGAAGRGIGGVWGAITGRAVGGPMEPGRPYITGEDGPELVTPGRSSHVTPADATAALIGKAVPSAAGGGDSYSIAVTLNVDGNSFADARQLERHATELVKVVQRELAREQRAAGKVPAGAGR